MKLYSLHHDLAILGAVLLCAAKTSTLAATITVTNTADSGSGSLRAALAGAANGDTIDATGVSGTIVLTNGELGVSNSVTIIGPGPGSLAVNGNYPNTTNRVFYVGFEVSVTIAGLTITNGNAGSDWGGGIFNDGSTLTVSNCTISGNAADTAGAILNGGESGPATLTIVNSTLSGNSADFAGGAIRNDGAFSSGNATLSIVSSTFSGNSAGIGGAIRNDGYAGGSAKLTIISSTFSDNSARDIGYGGAIHNSGDAPSEATLEIGSTIFKAGASGTNIVSSTNGVTSLGYNISSDNAGGFLTNFTDQINTDPKLGLLRNNGGQTLTHALLADSPAIDKGKNLSGSTTDQRGFSRTFDESNISNASGGDGTDIGAIESRAFVFTVLNTNDSGTGSLRAVIAAANASPGIVRIDFAPGVLGTITLTNGELGVSNIVTILGPGPGSLTVNGNYPNTTNRVFYISPLNNVTIAGLTITNGYEGNKGGGIYNERSSLTLSNCTLTGNYGGNGGGIYSDGESQGGSATLTVINSTVSGNSSGVGGGIYNDGFDQGHATLTLVNSTLSGNVGNSWGGGIYNDANSSGNGTITVVNSTLSGNSAGSTGGGIYSDASNFGNAIVTVASSTLSSNSATIGSAIYSDGRDGSAAVEIGSSILNAGASGTTLVHTNATVTSLGYNLSSDNGGALLTGTGDQTNTNPQLGPLQNNGGPTFTHALLTNSPAIDKGKRDAVTNLVSNTDQRSLLRPVDLPGTANASGGDGSDIGAFEVQLAIIPTPIFLTSAQKLLNGPFQFSFTNTPGASFTVLTSTNIALPSSNWTVLGAPIEISPGHFQYSDPQATNRPRSFYRVRSP